MSLSSEQVSTFNDLGYLVVERVLDTAQLDTLRARIEAIAAGEVDFPLDRIEFEPGACERSLHIDNLRKLNDCALHDAVFLKHAHNPTILDAVECLLGSDIKLFGDQAFLKPPGGIEKTWHQDSPYFTIEPMALVSSWVALDDVTLDNGCLWVIPGSHRIGPLAHSEVWMVGGRQDMRIPDTAFDASSEQPIVMRAGDCSFHHSLLLHRSGPNHTPQRRRGVATHYMNSRSRWTSTAAAKPDFALLRGRSFPGCV